MWEVLGNPNVNVHIYGFTGIQLCTLIYLPPTEVFAFRMLGTEALSQEAIRRCFGRNRVKLGFLEPGLKEKKTKEEIWPWERAG